jgi:hypothetical protein
MKTAHKRFVTLVLSVVYLSTIIVSSGCSGTVQAENLMGDISPQNVYGKPADPEFIANIADFSLELFRNTSTVNENSLVSPPSGFGHDYQWC